MDQDLRRTCELFIRNKDYLSNTFRWEGSAMHLVGSAILTAHDVEPETEPLKECAAIIKDNAPMLSPLRGYLKIMLTCNMLFSDDPEEYYRNVERAHNLIRITRRRRDQQYYLAAIALCNVINDKEELLGLVDTANEIYSRLKGIKGFLDMEKGFVLASVIAATSIKDIDTYFEEVEKCAAMLEDSYGRDYYTVELSCVLAIERADAGFKCGRLKEIIRLLDAQGIRYSSGAELPVLGTLAMLDLTNAETAGALAEADEFLRNCHGFGTFGCGSDKRHMYAALLVMCTYASVIGIDNLTASSVLQSAVTSQFAAMAASTMMVSSAVLEAMDTEFRLY